MVRKTSSMQPGHISVTFEIPDSLWANQVYLAGDFVGTSQSKMPMQQGRDGAWRLTVDLPAGQQYRYRYQIDQRWYTEWSADAATADGIDPHFNLLDLGS